MKNEQNKGKLNSLLGEPTPQKAAGISFSLAPMVSAALLIVTVIILTAFGVIKDNTYTEQGWFRYVSFLLPQIAFFVVILFYFAYTKRKVADACKAQKCHPKYFVWAVIMQIGLFSFGELNGLFLQFLQSLGYTPSPVVLPPLEGGWLVLTFIVVALLPALFEEIFVQLFLDVIGNFAGNRAEYSVSHTRCKSGDEFYILLHMLCFHDLRCVVSVVEGMNIARTHSRK
jgi:hypothetical protein